ncbi:hypothetical protein CDAR_113571 [Caerostris darwini]|uniref:Uncharacterized protein n=1 Tax=Caerostris darwini TaxID=1538125 RepID=A0AAV4NML0_9ARAC|nr:hypothetical protein CDAR_113571 [Caerostris darwini]
MSRVSILSPWGSGDKGVVIDDETGVWGEGRKKSLATPPVSSGTRSIKATERRLHVWRRTKSWCVSCEQLFMRSVQTLSHGQSQQAEQTTESLGRAEKHHGARFWFTFLINFTASRNLLNQDGFRGDGIFSDPKPKRCQWKRQKRKRREETAKSNSMSETLIQRGVCQFVSVSQKEYDSYIEQVNRFGDHKELAPALTGAWRGNYDTKMK